MLVKVLDPSIEWVKKRGDIPDLIRTLWSIYKRTPYLFTHYPCPPPRTRLVSGPCPGVGLGVWVSLSGDTWDKRGEGLWGPGGLMRGKSVGTEE